MPADFRGVNQIESGQNAREKNVRKWKTGQNA